MIPFLAFAFPFGLYLACPSMLWNFDGVACAAALEYGDAAFFFHSNHLLYGGLGFLFWKFIGMPAGLVRALPALQVFTSLLGAAGLVSLYLLLRHILRHTLPALLLTWTLAVTAIFWIWSLEAQVYTLAFVPLGWATFLLVASKAPHKLRWVGLLHGAAVLGHVLHFLWVLPASYWIYRQHSQRQRRKCLLDYAGIFVPTVILPYLVVIALVLKPQVRGAEWLWIWLKGSAGLTPDRSWAWHSVGWIGPWIGTKAMFQSLWGISWAYGHVRIPAWLWLMAGLSIGGFVYLVIRSWAERRNPLWGFSVLWLAAYGVFLWTWEPGMLCYRLTDVIPYGILLALGLSGWRHSYQTAMSIFLCLSFFSVNWISQIRPMHRIELNPTYSQVLAVARSTPSNALYLTHEAPLWLYLLYFTGRSAWNVNRLDPSLLAQSISLQKKERPIYIQSSLLRQETSRSWLANFKVKQVESGLPWLKIQ